MNQLNSSNLDERLTLLTKRRPVLLYILLVLYFEKFIQHLFVSYAFLVDIGGIRESVALNYRFLKIAGLLVGIFFLFNIPFLYKRKRYSYAVLLILALFDFIGEFFAQRTLVIDVTVSFTVSSAILLILILRGKRLVNNLPEHSIS